MFKRFFSWAIRQSLYFGRLSIIRMLRFIAPQEFLDEIKYDYYWYFRLNAGLGRVDVLEYLEQKMSDGLLAAINAYDYFAFRWAAQNGHVEVLHYFEEKAPDELLTMIRTNGYEAFRWAAQNGHVEVLHYLDQKASDELLTMIRTNEYEAFRWAAQNGHVEVLHYLEQKASDELLTMIRTNGYQAFRMAGQNGHVEILHYLEQKAPDELLAMIRANRYEAFRMAGQNGHVEILHYLEQKAPDELLAMIRANRYETFRLLNGRDGLCHEHRKKEFLDVFQYLEQKSPNEIQIMVRAGNYQLFRLCAHHDFERGYSNFTWWIPWSQLYDRFHYQEAVTHHLLTYTSVFGFAEAHYGEYFTYVRPLVNKYLTTLRTEKAEFEKQESNVPFDVSLEQANKYFYCLRNLIRLNNQNLRNDMFFLINIPAVKILLHTEVTAHQPNELLLLAMSLGNQEAVSLLLDVPAVRQLARENNYYQNEVHNGLDVRALALDRESSLRALTVGEQKRIETIQKYYNPIIQQKGVTPLMNELREKLESRYAKNPAFIVLGLDDNGEPIHQVLPLKREDFDLLPLNKEHKEEALKAYYQHQDHCALRYLSKPNQWMHEQAGYVNVNLQDPTQKWSTFDEYEPLIALLYIAATDEKTTAIDGYTIETRFERFIAELAQINRAHNWDKSRDTAKGKEEYDDLEGDRPSCFSGVKRRLFQSIHGHPLFSLFTIDKLKEELRVFSLNHFKHAITKHNRQQLKEAWGDVCMGNVLSETQKLLLKSLDMNVKEKDKFVALLTQKYEEQFSNDTSFQTLISQAFTIIPPTENHLCSSAFSSTKWWDFLEPQAEFMELLNGLEKKKEERLVHYPEANEQAKIIIRELTAKANVFYRLKSPTAEEIKQFKSDCLEVVHNNSSTLLEHRTILGSLLASFRQFFNALTATLRNEPSRYGFFETKTESAKIIEDMETGIRKLSIAVH